MDMSGLSSVATVILFAEIGNNELFKGKWSRAEGILIDVIDGQMDWRWTASIGQSYSVVTCEDRFRDRIGQLA